MFKKLIFLATFSFALSTGFLTQGALAQTSPDELVRKNTNEILAALVIVAVAAFWWRRNSNPPLKRFSGPELRLWPKLDANIILYVEVVLMAALFFMNTADLKLHQMRGEDLPGTFPISNLLVGLLPTSVPTLHVLERLGWWAHITGIFLFLNYLPSSKHFHIIMAFPGVWYSRLVPQGQFSNVASITNEVKAMMDPSFVVPPAPTAPDGSALAPAPFGAKDVDDLPWTNLLAAYSCTECGRCTSVCPANLTGKLLSPRKIIMDTRDRVEELTRFLKGRGLAAEALHGKMLQPERDKSMMKLRNGSATVLVATDVAARGLDVNELDTVVQFDMPDQPDTFMHRSGRTARAGAVGTAHLIATAYEQQKLQNWPAASSVQWAGLRPPALPDALPKPPRPSTVTLHVSAGKSEKISRGDLAGAFVSVGGLERDAVGRIEVFDHHSFVAVPEAQAEEVLARMQGAKVKGKKVKVALIR